MFVCVKGMIKFVPCCPRLEESKIPGLHITSRVDVFWIERSNFLRLEASIKELKFLSREYYLYLKLIEFCVLA